MSARDELRAAIALARKWQLRSGGPDWIKTVADAAELHLQATCDGTDCMWVKDRLPPDHTPFLKCVQCGRQTFHPEARNG
jgi:hypothetical protein